MVDESLTSIINLIGHGGGCDKRRVIHANGGEDVFIAGNGVIVGSVNTTVGEPPHVYLDGQRLTVGPVIHRTTF
jgi:hypothetical protein